jgi:hypothetical protein
MRARSSAEGNGDNTLSYTCNVRAHTRAHARVMGVKTAVASVATVANSGDWPTNTQNETVAQTVASGQTVATIGDPPGAAKIFTLGCSAQGVARGPP